MGDLAAIRRYKRALATYERAGKARSAAFEALFKPGDRIVHNKGERRTGATILRVHGCSWSDDSLFIRSDSGKEYGISAFFVVSINGEEVRDGR